MPRWMKWAIALAVGFAIIALGWRVSGRPFLGLILPTFFVINCFVLIVVVLLQSGKAADLAGAFGGAGSQTAFGPRGAANALSNATTWCAIMFMVCAFALVVRTDKSVSPAGSVLQKVSQPAPKPAPATTPAIPVPQQNTHDSLPAGQQPASQPPASQAPATSQPAPMQPQSGQPGPAKPQSSQPATGQQPPASSQPAPTPTPTKKP